MRKNAGEIPRRFVPPDSCYFLFGPRGTGKTTLLKALYPDSLRIDLDRALSIGTIPLSKPRPTLQMSFEATPRCTCGRRFNRKGSCETWRALPGFWKR